MVHIKNLAKGVQLVSIANIGKPDNCFLQMHGITVLLVLPHTMDLPPHFLPSPPSLSIVPILPWQGYN